MLMSKGKETLKCSKSMSGQVRGEYEPQRFWLEALQVCVVLIAYDLLKFVNNVCPSFCKNRFLAMFQIQKLQDLAVSNDILCLISSTQSPYTMFLLWTSHQRY